MSGAWRRRMIQNLPPTAACQTLVMMVGSAIRAIASGSGRTSEVSAMVMVGRPSPTNPLTVPASRKTARPKMMSAVVMERAQLMPPRDDRGDQGQHGDGLGKADARPGAHRGGWRFLRLGFGPAALVFGHPVQAVDQARQAAQALRPILDGAADRGAR